MIQLFSRSNVMCVAICLVSVATATGQLSGSRGGLQTQQHSFAIPLLTADIAQSYITIEGQAEIRVKPTEIRVVIAVTAEGKTATECQRLVNDKVKSLRDGWVKAGIPREDVIEDFIAVLPRYDFHIEKEGEREVARERE